LLLVSFSPLWKTPQRNNLKEEGFILAHVFRGLTSEVFCWLNFLGPEERKNIMVVLEMLISWQVGSRDKRKGWNKIHHSRHTLSTCFLCLVPTSYFLPYPNNAIIL
jgi:hypothetical protein